MFDLEALEVVFDPLGYEVSTIIRDDGVRDPIPGDDVIPDEFPRRHGSDYLVQGCLHPLGEVVDGHHDKPMTIRGGQVYGTNDINPPG